MMRTMDDLHLIDFVELQLKSKDGFSKAYDLVVASGLAAYLKKFVIIQPGDWPCQFYCRQLIYESLAQYQQSIASQQHQQSTASQQDQQSTASQQEHQSSTSTVETSKSNQIPAITSLIPTMGPLHISLNSREDIFETFRPFFNQVYSYLFPNSKLTRSPKPWRINLILEQCMGPGH